MLRKLEALGIQPPFNGLKVICLTELAGSYRRIILFLANSQLWSPSRVNDTSDVLTYPPLIYAHDTTLFEIVDEPAASAGRLNSDPNMISEWADKCLVTMNPVKSRNVVFFSQA